ncbi:MAG: hypothetical protein ACRD15_05125 [Vicinamibacterales bacterium]
MTETPAGIADVIVAAQALELRGAALEAAVSMCGYALASRLETSKPPEAAPIAAPAPDAEEAPEAIDVTIGAEALPPSVLRLEPARTRRMSSVPADPLSAPAAKPRGSARPFAGLFAGRDAVDLLRLSASVLAPTDRIDVPRVTNELANARPLLSLPYVAALSLGLGAQVLVDVGVSMQPFWDDQQALIQRIRTLLRGLADIRYFADDPALGAGPDRRKRSWTTYELPRPETPVIAVTDLGCGFPPRVRATRAWLALASRLRRRNSRVVAFAPVRLSRLPLPLRHAVEIVVWDRSARRQNLSRLLRAVDE